MKKTRTFSLLIFGLFILLFRQPVFAADADSIAKCDQLAAHPDDPYRTAEGVRASRLDVAQAQAVCEEALEDEPTNPRIIFQLGRVYRAQGLFEQAADFLERAVQDGYPAAEFELAEVLEKGQVSRPELSPVKLYLSAAENDYLPAMSALVLFYLNEILSEKNVTAQNFKLARYWLNRAVEAEDSDAQFLLGSAFKGGWFGEKDPQAALLWFRKSAAQNNVRGLHVTGTVLWTGVLGEQNDEEALGYFRKLIEIGEFEELPPSIAGYIAFFFGEAYENGRGVEVDNDEAQRWFDRALAAGNPLAKLRLMK